MRIDWILLREVLRQTRERLQNEKVDAESVDLLENLQSSVRMFGRTADGYWSDFLFQNCLDGQSYQPRVCNSCDSSIAAAASPFIVPVTCSLTSARTFASL